MRNLPSIALLLAASALVVAPSAPPAIGFTEPALSAAHASEVMIRTPREFKIDRHPRFCLVGDPCKIKRGPICLMRGDCEPSEPTYCLMDDRCEQARISRRNN